MSESGFASFLRWAGSKRKLLPILKQYWKEENSRYIEPFAGSACLFFQVRPEKAILGDINQDLIQTYIEVKYRLDDLMSYLREFKNCKSEYLNIRRIPPDSLSPSHRAARFIYLNRFSFNGLFRTNLDGQFNVPYGGKRSGDLPTYALMKKCSNALQKARLVSGDFQKILKEVKKGDFVYMDPPFRVKSRRVFIEYDPSCFTHEDVWRLRKCLEELARKQVDFLVSFAESEEARCLAEGFFVKKVLVWRHIAGFASHRRYSCELLISSSPHVS